jgi:hypothetical protein
VLAGRKAMDVIEITDPDTGEVTKDINTVGRNAVNKYLAYNFPEGTFGASTIHKVIDVDDPSELRLELSTEIDATMLKVVGVENMELATECTARRDGYNVDVVMVLDVTGSMKDSLAGANDNSYERMNALKVAGENFLEILEELHAKSEALGLRVRVGIVPYSQTVNVGRELYDDESSYIQTTGLKYRSIVGQIAKSGTAKWVHTATNTDNGSGQTGEVTLDLTEFVTQGFAEGHGSASTYVNPYLWRGCVEMRPTIQSINSSTPLSLTDDDWDNAWDVHDVAPGVGGAPKYQPYIRLPSNSTTSGTYGPPQSSQSMATVWQLNVNTSTPAFNTTRVPYRVSNTSSSSAPVALLSNAVSSDYQSKPEESNGPNGVCPDRVVLLSDEDTDRTDFINALTPTGGTYHNIGMYWGLALISPQKPFENPDKWRDSSKSSEPPADVKRYIVFMTDGDLNPSEKGYTAFGYEPYHTSIRNDVSATTADPDGGTAQNLIIAAHRRRFEAMCRWATTNNITVSTVAFSSSITTADKNSLKNCASSTANYYEATTASKLNEAFEKIAHDIANLRITE